MEALTDAIINAQSLTCVEWISMPSRVSTIDASDVGMGAIIEQEYIMMDGV